MVHFLPVAELVDHDIVQYIRRCEDKPPVKRKIALAAAASPSGLLIPDGYFSIGHAQNMGIVRDSFWKVFPGSFAVKSFQTLFGRSLFFWTGNSL